MGEAQGLVPGYISPVTGSIHTIRETILSRAKSEGWTVDPGQLDDRQIVRRMVLKRCIYGVDKNPMAVELAKVSLWLHTFTVGAPLSFLDHHLRCGDSLFGYWIDEGRSAATQGGMFLSGPLKLAEESAQPMQQIEALSDAELSEAVRSAELWSEVQAGTTPLAEFLSLLRSFEWLAPIEAKRRKTKQTKVQQGLIASWLTGIYGDPVAIAAKQTPVDETIADSDAFIELLASARAVASEERFLHWQVAFPGVWQDWDDKGRPGGFDAVIGNPPWDRMRLEQVEWFALRRPEIAEATRAADRRRMMRELEEDGDPLAAQFRRASDRVAAAMRTARVGKQYPLLSSGDINLYSLFVERALTLLNPRGVVGLLTPSGIASDRNAARFFGSMATSGRLRALYDFENRRTRFDTDEQKAPPFFPHVDTRFKFCAFVVGRSASDAPASCGFFLQDVSELRDDDRCFALTSGDFAQVNPNTGTAPVFLSRRDAELATGVYRRTPVLVNHTSGEKVAAWPVRYERRLDMTNDSDGFRSRAQLEEDERAWPVAGNRFDSATGIWLPLHEGKMVQAFDHRAANVEVNPRNLHRPAQPKPASTEQHGDPAWLPHPQYWVNATENRLGPQDWQLAFKDVTSPTNIRSMIAAIIPTAAAGNTLPLLVPEDGWASEPPDAPDDDKPRAALLVANLNSIMFDYLARQKIHGQHLNWYIVEQLPVIAQELALDTHFGPCTAAEVIQSAVLELTYTSHDLAPFARHVGHINDVGEALPPFPWNPERRQRLMAKLDAVFFHLYGITNRDDIRHIYSTFPILERREQATHGQYLTRNLCLAYLNALTAGQPDAEPDV